MLKKGRGTRFTCYLCDKKFCTRSDLESHRGSYEHWKALSASQAPSVARGIPLKSRKARIDEAFENGSLQVIEFNLDSKFLRDKIDWLRTCDVCKGHPVFKNK